MSGHKIFLQLAVLVTVVNIFVAGTCLVLGLSGLVTPDVLQPYVMTSFLLLFPIWGTAVVVMVEFTKLIHEGQSWWRRSRGLRLIELKQLVRWCPPPLTFVSLGALALGFAGSLSQGGAHWQGGEVFTNHHVVGFCLGTIVFCAAALPVLVSAARMPGRFADHFKPGTIVAAQDR